MKKYKLLFITATLSYLFNCYFFNTFDFKLFPLEFKIVTAVAITAIFGYIYIVDYDKKNN